MRQVFADNFYWVALLNPRDAWHQTVNEFTPSLESAYIVTTDEVLTEFLNFFGDYNLRMRQEAIQKVQEIMESDRIFVIPSNRESFLRGFELYKQRSDKGYSLTDCISMQIMKQLDITEVLTHDKHFT